MQSSSSDELGKHSFCTICECFIKNKNTGQGFMLLVLVWRSMHEKKLLNRALGICIYFQSQYINKGWGMRKRQVTAFCLCKLSPGERLGAEANTLAPEYASGIWSEQTCNGSLLEVMMLWLYMEKNWAFSESWWQAATRERVKGSPPYITHASALERKAL